MNRSDHANRHNKRFSHMANPVISKTAAANPALLRIDVAKYGELVKALRQRQLEKTETAAAARVADEAYKATLGQVLRAMEGQDAAICGSAVLVKKTGKAADATVKSTMGVAYKLADVERIIIGNTTLMQADIMSVFGGRSGSESVEVSGEV